LINLVPRLLYLLLFSVIVIFAAAKLLKYLVL
jgi:hypothetical protein